MQYLHAEYQMASRRLVQSGHPPGSPLREREREREREIKKK